MATSDKAKKRVTVIGYGSQGHALALNLRDSGYEVSIGLRPRSKSRRTARHDRFQQVMSIADAVRQADILCMAFPDHLHGRVFSKTIQNNLREGATLWFLHGMSVHFGLIKPPAGCDVFLIAPHAPGTAVREKYLDDRTLSAFYAVAQNYSGKAKRTLLELAKAAGFERKRLVETTFEAEAVGDMFGEQAVLCGGLTALIKNGFEVLVEKGYKPEHAYLEVAYQLDLIVDLIKKHGIEGMFDRISVTARYGSLTAGPKIIDASVRKKMVRVFSEIETGRFARKLSRLTEKEISSLKKNVKSMSHPDLEKAAKKFSR